MKTSKRVTKKELITEIESLIKKLSVYDKYYYSSINNTIYKQAKVKQLSNFLDKLNTRLNFVNYAVSLGAKITPQKKFKNPERFIRDGYVFRNVGPCYVRQRKATDNDIKTMLIFL